MDSKQLQSKKTELGHRFFYIWFDRMLSNRMTLTKYDLQIISQIWKDIFLFILFRLQSH